ncbi:hypothetical protein BDV10DRAFT_108535 [Aspergillus recurvatus]
MINHLFIIRTSSLGKSPVRICRAGFEIRLPTTAQRTTVLPPYSGPEPADPLQIYTEYRPLIGRTGRGSISAPRIEAKVRYAQAPRTTTAQESQTVSYRTTPLYSPQELSSECSEPPRTRKWIPSTPDSALEFQPPSPTGPRQSRHMQASRILVRIRFKATDSDQPAGPHAATSRWIQIQISCLNSTS